MDVCKAQKKKTDYRHLRRKCKWSAGEALKIKGSLLSFVTASFIAVFFFIAPLYMLQSVAYFVLPRVSTALTTAVFFIAYLVFAPVFMGLVRMAVRMSKGMDTHVSDVLWGFDGRGRLRDIYAVSLSVIARGIFALFASVIASSLAVCFITGSPLSEMTFGQTVALLVLAFVLFVFFVALSPRITLLPIMLFENEDASFGEAHNLTKKTLRGHRSSLVAFNLSFLPLVILSVLTLGILFFVYLLPLYMISMHKYASHLLED